MVASGLIAKHGVDHGSVEPGVIAHKSICIADAIINECDPPEPEGEPFSEPKPEVPAPAPISNSGDSGSQTPVPPAAEPSE